MVSTGFRPSVPFGSEEKLGRGRREIFLETDEEDTGGFGFVTDFGFEFSGASVGMVRIVTYGSSIVSFFNGFGSNANCDLASAVTPFDSGTDDCCPALETARAEFLLIPPLLLSSNLSVDLAIFG
jgi:hypothetical protein